MIFSKKTLSIFGNKDKSKNKIKKIKASDFEINTKLMIKTLEEYSRYLRNNGNTKLTTKKQLHNIINEMVEQELFFDGFTIVKDIMLHIDKLFKNDNIKNSLISFLKAEYKVNDAAIDPVNAFLNNKLVENNDLLNKYINQFKD